jgi:phosphoribosylformimino-5-aminoimidazole carboxamide ribotide isomerase
MILWPAIDILGGKAVRLLRGEFGTETAYDDDPRDAASRWVEAGARALHVVDLDGAKEGVPVNLEQLRRIADIVRVPIQFGGGLRSAGAIQAALAAGASRVLLGTAAYRDPELLELALAEHGERVVVSLDARGGTLAGAGWREETGIPVEAAVERLCSQGVRQLVYSSIERDGMLAGPDLDGARRVAALVEGSLLYSGGTSTLADLERLASLGEGRLAGVIVGKALYEERFTVSEAQAVLDGATQGRCTTSA